MRSVWAHTPVRALHPSLMTRDQLQILQPRVPGVNIRIATSAEALHWWMVRWPWPEVISEVGIPASWHQAGDMGLSTTWLAENRGPKNRFFLETVPVLERFRVGVFLRRRVP